MDTQTLLAIGQAPVVVLLIYITMRQQNSIEKLLQQIVQIQSKYSQDMLDMAMKFAEKLENVKTKQ